MGSLLGAGHGAGARICRRRGRRLMAEVRAAFRRWEHPDVRLAARAVSIRILKASSIDEELIWRNVLFYLGPFRLSPALTNATGLVSTIGTCDSYFAKNRRRRSKTGRKCHSGRSDQTSQTSTTSDASGDSPKPSSSDGAYSAP